MNDSLVIESEFDALFENIGYQRVDKYIGKSPTFSNADYIDFEKKVIVELKVLDKDFFAEGGVVDSLQMFIPVPKNIQKDGQGWYEFKMPELNRKGRPDTLEIPLTRIIKKANKQLKETNKELLNNEGHGFLIFAINMKTVIDPRIIQHLTINILKKEFHSVNGVIFCTPKIGLVHENGFFQPICLHCQDSDLPQSKEDELMKIVDEWCNFIDNDGH